MVSRNSLRLVVALLVGGCALASLGGCAGGGSNMVRTDSAGVIIPSVVTDVQGRQYDTESLVVMGGHATFSGKDYVACAAKKSTMSRIGDGFLNAGTSLVGGLGGAYAGRAVSNGPIGTSVGAVTGSAAAGSVKDGITGAGDPNVIWICTDTPGFTQYRQQPQQQANAQH